MIPFEELCQEIIDMVGKYKLTCGIMSKKDVQEYRDILSSLAVTLAVYGADFYEDAIGAEVTRKIKEAKEIERIISSGEVKSQGRAEVQAKINCEEQYNNEVRSNYLNTKSKFLREQINQVLHSMSSRLGTFDKEKS